MDKPIHNILNETTATEYAVYLAWLYGCKVIGDAEPDTVDGEPCYNFKLDVGSATVWLEAGFVYGEA